MIPLFWFMGIHGPSVVKPALNAALFGNITTNLATLQAGGHPALALTENFGNYIGELGGTAPRSLSRSSSCSLCAPSSSRPSAKPLSYP